MTNRLLRSMLAVPATSEKFIPKAAASDADAVFLDLEDSVAEHRKEAARAAVIRALQDIDWGRKYVLVRINDIHGPWGYRDIVDIAEATSRLDSILLPKTGEAADVEFVDVLLSGIEARRKVTRPIGIDALIETPRGVANVESIAGASARLRGLSYGVGDYTVAMKAPQTNFGTPDASYGVLTGSAGAERREFHWGDQWHFAMARICNACRANGLRPMDGPFTDLADQEGYEVSARRARALGYEGKWAIHPKQIAIANAVFSPTTAEVAWARQVTDAMRSAIKEGNGAAQYEGRMIDLAHVRQAEDVLTKQELVRAAEG